MYFWLGPLGDLRLLPPIESDVEPTAPAAAPVGEFEALGGALTRDRLGRHRRAWNLEWKYLPPAEIDEIDALRSGHAGLPLWLLDPQRPNLAPRQVATTGSEERSVKGWTATAGVVTWSELPRTQRPPGVTRAGVITWTLAQGEEGVLSVGRNARALRVPTEPREGPVCAAAFARQVGDNPAGSVLTVDAWDAAGVRSDGPTALSTFSTSWLDLAAAGPVPVGTVAMSASWSSSGPSVMQLCGVRYGHGTTIPHPDGGGGAALVVPRDMPETYPGQDEISAALQLAEV